MRQLSYRRHHSRGKNDETKGRIYLLMFFSFVIFGIIVLRLFQLQVVRHSLYASIAEEQHIGTVELPAKRGDIYVIDSHSGEKFKVATNTTLDLLYVDPNVEIDEEREKITVEGNRKRIAQELPPLIFDKEEYEICKENVEDCFYNILEEESLKKDEEVDPKEWSEEDKNNEREVSFKSYSLVLEEIEDDILEQISQTEVNFVVLWRDADEDLIADIKNEELDGVYINDETFLIYADPTLISAKELDETARILANHLKKPATEIKAQLSPRDVRYVFIKNKLSPDTSQKIKALISPEGENEIGLKGVVLIPEHWRYYPEGNLASQVIGYMDRNNFGQYGIEGYMNSELEGKKGSIISESDPSGRQITVGETEIIEAVDGDSIVLTIDRIVQREVEEIIAQKVEEFGADSGQVIVMDPHTGAIIAMANAPSFDPNNYADSLKMVKLTQEEVEKSYRTTRLFKKNEKNKYVDIEEEDKENEEVQKYAYENRLGNGVFKNRTVSEYYEPGSVFKPLIMAMALDANEVSPETTFNDTGPIKSDIYFIKNSDEVYHGITTMTQVLEKSLNTGMIRVSQKLGMKLMYKYLKDYGFAEYTNIKLADEEPAYLKYYGDWSETDQFNISFGQGIVVTPLQLITAWSVLANGGKLVEPHIVNAVIRDDQVIETEPEVVHRVISQETATIISSMLVNVIKNGHGYRADIEGHLIAGKTGTAQIAGPGGFETGIGSTTTTFMGYFPALEPEYVVLVKFDRPRAFGEEDTWASNTAAPTFKEVVKFLIDYYKIEPTE